MSCINLECDVRAEDAEHLRAASTLHIHERMKVRYAELPLKQAAIER